MSCDLQACQEKFQCTGINTLIQNAIERKREVMLKNENNTKIRSIVQIFLVKIENIAGITHIFRLDTTKNVLYFKINIYFIRK